MICSPGRAGGEGELTSGGLSKKVGKFSGNSRCTEKVGKYMLGAHMFWTPKSKCYFSKMYQFLKSCNFGDIEPILVIFDVLKSSGSVVSHNRTYFPVRFRERSSNLGSDLVDFVADQIFLILVVLHFSKLSKFWIVEMSDIYLRYKNFDMKNRPSVF